MDNVTFKFLSEAEGVAQMTFCNEVTMGIKLVGTIMSRAEEVRCHPNLPTKMTSITLNFPKHEPGNYVLRIENPVYDGCWGQDESIQYDAEKDVFYMEELVTSDGDPISIDCLIGPQQGENIRVEFKASGHDGMNKVIVINNQLKFFDISASAGGRRRGRRTRQTLSEALAAQAAGDTGKALVRVISY